MDILELKRITVILKFLDVINRKLEMAVEIIQSEETRIR